MLVKLLLIYNCWYIKCYDIYDGLVMLWENCVVFC